MGLYMVAIFVNALLLFSVEPMFTKMILPLLGGTPAVWNTALLFFQTALLVGYLYAHVTSRRMTPVQQAVLHVVLLLAALTVLPLHVSAAFRQPPESVLPIPWLLGLLTVSLGLPFVLLSAGAPMLQRWFAALRHPSAANPYFLYAASNLGSFVALLAYPTVIEPRLRLSEQSVSWLEVYYGLVILVAICAVAARRLGRVSGEALVVPPADVGAEPLAPVRSIVPSRAWRLRWVLLSFAPSSLLIGVTTYLSTDIASFPFLWVVPLAIYLLTFVLVFASRPPVNRQVMLWSQLVLGLTLMVTITMGGGRNLPTAALLHLTAFFATTMVCHRELADSRPGPEHLTEFYLWLSLGGVLGGVFNVILAPILYQSIVEYPFALIIAFGLRPSASASMGSRRSQLLDLALPALLFAAIFALLKLPKPPTEWGEYGLQSVLGVAALVAASFVRRPLRLALAAGAIYGAVRAADAGDPQLLMQQRSFFGVYRVRQIFQYHFLQHGTTTHGGQNWLPDHRLDPITYYHKEGPFGQFMQYAAADVPLRRVGVVGLGSGATACYGRKGEHWTYYEIDPLVPKIATHPRLFTYLKDCPPTIDIKLGDARLSLVKEPDATLDLLVVDAFSSDAIPVHLMTREALALYLRKLKPEGVVVFHISNRYLDLRPVLFALAIDAKAAAVIGDLDVNAEQRAKMYYGSRWVAMSRAPRALEPLARQSGWAVIPPYSEARVWTDDYSDVLGAVKRR
jgi:hypothetical protein